MFVKTKKIVNKMFFLKQCAMPIPTCRGADADI